MSTDHESKNDESKNDESKNVTTYFCEYKLLPEHQTRDVCMVFFGGMTMMMINVN